MLINFLTTLRRLLLHRYVSSLFLGIICVSAYAGNVDDIYSTPGERADQANDIRGDDRGKWLPVPIPVSNPTIGTGLQAILLYLHPKKNEALDSPNATSGVGGLYTDSDSKAVGVFHDDYFLHDRLRFRALAASGDLNLKYFGVGDSLADYSINYNIKLDSGMLQGSALLPAAESWYIGLRYLWIDADITFETSDLFPVLPAITDSVTTSSLALTLTYDTRDDNYYPRQGSLFEVVLSEDNEGWGSDYNFSRNSAKFVEYLPLTARQTLALKASVSDVDGNAPFFLLSTLTLRGFPAGRYLDNSSASLHTEWRFKFHPRWGMVAFIEAGKVAESLAALEEEQTITSYGTGLRWQPVASKNMHLSLDFAWSEDDDAVYLRVGESF